MPEPQQSLLEDQCVVLANYPSSIRHYSSEEEKKIELTLGDLHGNALKLLYFLVREGILHLTKEQYQTLAEIYFKIISDLTKEDLDKFEKIIEDAHVTPVSLIRLIGDVFSDRGENDLLTLFILKKLHTANQAYSINGSNHDANFLLLYEGKNTYNTIVETQKRSFLNLKYLIEKGFIKQEFVNDLVARYVKPHLDLITYNIIQVEGYDQPVINLFTHAPVGYETIQALADFYLIPFSADSIESLINTLEQINKKFKEFIHDTDTFSKHYAKEFSESTLSQKLNAVHISKPHVRLFWNREHLPDVGYQIYFPQETPYGIYMIHGHTGPGGLVGWIPQKNIYFFNLDTNLGKDTLLNVATNEPQNQYRVLRNPVRHSLYLAEKNTSLNAPSPTLPPDLNEKFTSIENEIFESESPFSVFIDNANLFLSDIFPTFMKECFDYNVIKKQLDEFTTTIKEKWISHLNELHTFLRNNSETFAQANYGRFAVLTETIESMIRSCEDMEININQARLEATKKEIENILSRLELHIQKTTQLKLEVEERVSNPLVKGGNEEIDKLILHLRNEIPKKVDTLIAETRSLHTELFTIDKKNIFLDSFLDHGINLEEFKKRMISSSLYLTIYRKMAFLTKQITNGVTDLLYKTALELFYNFIVDENAKKPLSDHFFQILFSTSFDELNKDKKILHSYLFQVARIIKLDCVPRPFWARNPESLLDKCSVEHLAMRTWIELENYSEKRKKEPEYLGWPEWNRRYKPLCTRQNKLHVTQFCKRLLEKDATRGLRSFIDGSAVFAEMREQRALIGLNEKQIEHILNDRRLGKIIKRHNEEVARENMKERYSERLFLISSPL